MGDKDLAFDYVAVDASGHRRKGRITAKSDSVAFDRLKRDGLSPISIRLGRSHPNQGSRKQALSDRALAALLGDLGALLRAGADMRTALAILSSRSTGSLQVVARDLSGDVGGGESLEGALGKRLPRRFDFVAALVAAGEAGSDLASGFERAGEMLAARTRLRDQFISTVSYPAFVFATTIAALGVILFFVVPSLAPLVDDEGSAAPRFLAAMVATSLFLRAHVAVLGAVLIGTLFALLVGSRAGLIRWCSELMLLDGPARRSVGGIVYGGYAVALGTMLAGGAPIHEALRLAERSIGMSRARARLTPVTQSVRQGVPLSVALETVRSFPASIWRLAAVGEASGAMGAMIARAGRIEEDAALRRLERAGQILGPALIVFLGAVIGLMMAGLLSGVSQLGGASLQ